MKKIINKNLIKILLFYFTVFLVTPFVLHLSFREEFKMLYRDTELFESLVFVFVIIIIFIFSYKRPFKKKKFLISMPNVFMKNKIMFLLSILFLILSIHFFVKYGFQFRHRGENLSNVGGAIILLTALRSFFKAFLFISLMYQLKFKKNINTGLVYLIIGVSFWFSKVSSYDIPLIFISLIIGFNKVSFLTSQRAKKIKLLNNTYFRFLLIISIAFFTVFMGVANKIGSEKTIEVFSNKKSITEVVLKTGLRFSTYYASIFGAYSAYEAERETIKEAIPGTFINIFNRFIYLTGGGKEERPKYWSVNRSNYKNLFLYNNNPRTGASPGIVASVFYFNNLFFGIVLIAFYIFTIIGLLKESFELNCPKLNILGVFISFIFIIPYFESPIDYINIFNPSFIYFYFSLITLKKINYEKSLEIISIRNRT